MSKITDILKDLTSYAVPLKFTTVRVTSDSTKTLFEAIDDEKRIIMKATPKEPVTEFSGQFGMPSIKVLKGNVDMFETFSKQIPAGSKPATLDVQCNSKDKKDIPTDLEFNVPNFFHDTYRLQLVNIPAQPILKNPPVWEVEVNQPDKNKISVIAAKAANLADVEKNFSVKVDNRALKFYIGDETSSTSKSNVTLVGDIDTVFNPQLYWRCENFLSIMNLASSGSVVVKFSNMFIQINIDSGLIDYEFLLPGAKD